MELLGTTRTDQDIKNAILELAEKNKQVIYGARAVNEQLPSHLRRKTEDYDVLTKDSESSARQLADKLNKIYGKERFKVQKAQYSKTWKVKDLEQNRNIADYTKTTKKPNSKIVLNVRYADTNYIKRKIHKTLKDESSSFRFDKDLDTLKRIKQSEDSLRW